MLKEKLSFADPNKKSKIIVEQNYYQKIKLIGQGTFGKVYLVYNKKDKKHYALKQVLQDKRYKNRQLGIISRVLQSNIIHMTDYFIKVINEQCILSLVMDYIPSSLNIMIKEQRKVKVPFEADVRKVLSFQLFKALYYMQNNKVCHRDLKPPNILINDKTLELKVCDFGSAKILQVKEDNVSYICSRYYRAPQLVLSSTTYGTQIDVWSAGCIIVELLTLEPIFPGDSSIEQLIQIIKILGTPPAKYIKIHQEAQNNEMVLPKIKPNDWNLILKKYHPQPQLVDLIGGILTYDTEKRLQPHQLLKHKYFYDLPTYKDHLENIPQLLSFEDLKTDKNAKFIKQLQQMYCSSLKLKERNDIKEAVVESTPNTFNQ